MSTLFFVSANTVRTTVFGTAFLLLCTFPTFTEADDPPAKQPPTLIGRWDLTVNGQDGKYPSWLEVQRSGYRTLVGSYVGRFGSARPISKIELKEGNFHFTVPPQWEGRNDDITFDGKLEGNAIRGETTDDKGKRITWEGHRAPSL